jgi:Glycosyl hydrolase catalytic core
VTTLLKIAASVALACALAVLAPAEGDAAKRKVPRNFVGVTWDGTIRAAPEKFQRRQFRRIAAAGAETVRVGFYWGPAQPERDGPIDLTDTDRIVEMASAGRVRVFPHIIISPTWNRWDLSDQLFAPPAEPEYLRPLMQALIERYGPDGSFWAEHSELPRLPIRHWQFWNEPHLTYQWTIPDNASWHGSYAWELGFFHSAVKEFDPGAKVVLAGLTNESWKALKKLYRRDVGDLFDIAAIHPYTATPSGVVELVRRFRRVMKRNGDADKPLWVTEVGLPASRGKTESESNLQTNGRGQARFLRKSFAALRRARRRPSTRVERVYWYTWASEYRGDQIFRWAGMLKYKGGDRVVKRRSYRAFVRTARRLQGCRKTASGLCRR